jgi:hypothetical protein
MSNELHPVWQQVELLLNDGINLVPVRDRDENINGKLRKKKTPYNEWTLYQTARIDRQELFNQMEAHNTTAVAMVCGAISGNLEGIDIDEKYLPGISARFFTDLKELYPDIYNKLRVHKTPSGGCHIPYRIEPGHEVPGSQKLALRAATDDELLANPKLKTRCFIETRGTGALMTCPPSVGYTVRKDHPIPVLTWVERCTLIEFCKSYNTYIKLEQPYKPNRAEVNYYDENPFEHYNRAVDPVELITQFGWTYVATRNGYIWFTKPGGSRGDVHASFNIEKRFYFVFSANADLDGDRAYNPATILAHYQFNGDKQRAYQWLVQNGYGRIKPAVEQRIARKAALTGNELPVNISDAGRQLHNEVVQQLTTNHPHGIFWEADDKDILHISRERLYIVAEALGFRWVKQTEELVQIVDIFIYRRDERYFYDALKDYIHEEDGDLHEDICNAYEAFIEKHGKFSARRLPLLQTDKVLIDTRDTCYKFYQNGCVIITNAAIDLVPYDQLANNLIWAEKIQWRDYAQNNTGGLYVDFLNKAVELDKNREHIMRTLGYLAHEYKDETTAYFVVLSEQCPDPMQGGGSGKNLFCNLLKLTTTYTSVPGAQKKCDEKFLQTWRGQKIFAISDAPKDFNFGFLKELTSGDAILKKLFKDEMVVTVNDLPKFIIQTNWASDIEDGGIKGRIIQIEFTGFFTRKCGINKRYGKHFPNDWVAEDYAGYDTFICQCVQAWLQGGLTLTDMELSATGWEKQFIVMYGQTVHDFIKENWTDWIGRKFVANQIFNQQLIDFMRENNISERYKPTSQKINKALKEWCVKNNYGFEKDVVRRDGFATEKGREFLEFAPF